jgi:dTMP kinase
MARRGLFITVEGIEGVGKSTQLLRLARRLESAGREVVMTREPGGTPLAESIRQLVLQPRGERIPADAELLLMFAARVVHTDNLIKPALARGACVLCDRYHDATYAYQGGGRGIAREDIDRVAALALRGFAPDLTLLFDAPVSVALARMRARGAEPDRFEAEQQAFFGKARDVYLARLAAEPGRIKLVDATQSPEQVEHAVWQQVAALTDRESGVE